MCSLQQQLIPYRSPYRMLLVPQKGSKRTWTRTAYLHPKPINILRRKLAHVKDKQTRDKQRNVVYGLTCAEKDCKESYMGETNNLSEPGSTNTIDPARVKPKTLRFTRTSKTQATFSTQRRLLFWTKKNVGLKEVCGRQFGREWNNHHLTRKVCTFSPVTCVGPGTEGHPSPSITWPVNRFTNLMKSGGSGRNVVRS